MEFKDLMQIVNGFQASRILHSAVELGVFEAIKGNSIEAVELSELCGTNINTTEILLNALVSMELLSKEENRYSNNESSKRFLLKGSESYIGDIIQFTGDDWKSWEKLTLTIREGTPQEKPYMEKRHESEWEYFIRGMHNFALSRGDAAITAELIDLSKATRLLDVACGPGTYSYELCKKYPDIKALLFDLPETITIAKKISMEYSLGERLEFVEGDYKTDNFPESIDCALLFNMVHQETSEENIKLFEKISKSLNKDGVLLIKDHILNEGKTAPYDGSTFSVQMQLMTGGRCYSGNEIKSWLSDVGFRDIDIKDPVPPMTSAFVTGIR